MTIVERFIYGQMTFETSPWVSPFVFVDRTADIVNSIAYAEGGRVGTPAAPQTDVGTLNVTLRNLASVPAVGDIVRLKRTGTSEFAFIGYVQDVSQQIIFDNSVSFGTPVTLTTLFCLDWVGYLSQFEAQGVGGLSAGFVKEIIYPFQSRARALNKIVDSTNATQIIAFSAGAVSPNMADTDVVGTFTDHLDLAAATQNLYWHGVHTTPTNKTTGRTGLVKIQPIAAAPSSGKTFTDLVGSPGQLHYVEVEQQSSTQNIANNIVLKNHVVNSAIVDVTKLGGGNTSYYKIVGGVQVAAFDVDHTYVAQNATSITSFGNRTSTFETNLQSSLGIANLVGNPSLEYGDDGWQGAGGNVVRRETLLNSTPFAAFDGEWALRMRLASATLTPEMRYLGTEIDGIPVETSNSYAFRISAARGTPNRADVRGRAFIRYFDDDGATISTTFSSQHVFGSTSFVWHAFSQITFAPAGAVRAFIGVEWNRTGGGNFSAGDQFYVDAALLQRGATVLGLNYFDGDTPTTSSKLYSWTGVRGESPSVEFTNAIDQLATTYLARYANTSNRITRIRWNAQEDLTAVYLLTVGSTIAVTLKGTTTTHRIVGINGDITTDRYMIDYYLEKV